MAALGDDDSSANIQVVVRVRPMNEREKKDKTLPVVTASFEKSEVTIIKGTGPRQLRNTFKFDSVFTGFSTQQEIFDTTLSPVVDDVMNGFESTVFAYGQTGTGKTYTMEGNLSVEAEHGVIPRATQAIFKRFENDPSYTEFAVSASYLEIYNEELTDLLLDESKDNPKLSVVEDQGTKQKKGRGVFVMNLSEQKVENAARVLELMSHAQERRQVGETRMNKQSSRSHCLFTLRVSSKRTLEDGSVMECAGKLHMVDLAGSECAKSAGSFTGDKATAMAEASRERERKNINQSLLTLGRVITLLQSKSPGQRIPYRDSKLTRLLQDSLGGHCKTCVIATLSPSVLAADESLSTLNYAQSAHGIQNKPVQQSFLKVSMNRPATAGAGATAASGGTVQEWEEMECRLQYLEAQAQEAAAALARKHNEQQTILDKMEMAEKARMEAEDRENATRVAAAAAADAAAQLAEKMRVEIASVRHKLVVEETLLAKRVATEEVLAKEAETMRETLERCIAHGDILHSHLTQAHSSETSRRASSAAFVQEARGSLERLSGAAGVLADQALSQHRVAVQAALAAVQETASATSASFVTSVSQGLEELTAVLKQASENHVAEGEESSAMQIESHAALTGIVATMKEVVDGHFGQVSNAQAKMLETLKSGEDAIKSWAATTKARMAAAEADMARQLEEHASQLESDVAASATGLRGEVAALVAQQEGLAGLVARLQETSQQEGALEFARVEATKAAVQGLEQQVAALQSVHAELDAARRDHVAGQKAAELAADIVDLGVTTSTHTAQAKSNLASMATKVRDLREVLLTGCAEEAHCAGLTSLEASDARRGEALIRWSGEQQKEVDRVAEMMREGNREARHLETVEKARTRMAAGIAEQQQAIAQQLADLKSARGEMERQRAENEARLISTLSEHDREAARAQAAQMSELSEQNASLAAQKSALEVALAESIAAHEELKTKVNAKMQAAMKEVAVLLEEQVTGLTASSQASVQGLVAGNKALTQRNEGARAQVAETASALQCAGAARLVQVEAWGKAVGGSVAATAALEQVTSSLDAATAQFGDDLAAHAECVEEDGRRWGLANREAEAALRGQAAGGEEQGVVLLKEGLARLEAARVAGRAELQQQVCELQKETAGWGAVNKQVGEEMATFAAVTCEDAAQQLEGAWVDIAARLDGAASLVATWRAADDTCHVASERIAADCQVAEDAAAAEITRVRAVGEETRISLATMSQATLQSAADALQAAKESESCQAGIAAVVTAQLASGQANQLALAEAAAKRQTNVQAECKEVDTMVVGREPVKQAVQDSAKQLAAAVAAGTEALSSAGALHAAHLAEAATNEETARGKRSASLAATSEAVTSAAAGMVSAGNALKADGDEKLCSATELVKAAAEFQTAEVQAYASKHTADVHALDQSLASYGSDVSLINVSVPPLVAHADFPHSSVFTRTPPNATILGVAGIPQMTAKELAIVEGSGEQEMEDASPAEAAGEEVSSLAPIGTPRVTRDKGGEAAAENLNPGRAGKEPARSFGAKSAAVSAKRSDDLPLGTLNV